MFLFDIHAHTHTQARVRTLCPHIYPRETESRMSQLENVGQPIDGKRMCWRCATHTMRTLSDGMREFLLNIRKGTTHESTKWKKGKQARIQNHWRERENKLANKITPIPNGCCNVCFEVSITHSSTLHTFIVLFQMFCFLFRSLLTSFWFCYFAVCVCLVLLLRRLLLLLIHLFFLFVIVY